MWETLTFRDTPWKYLEAAQSRLADEVSRDPGRGFLLVSEPAATFTRGRSARDEDLLWSPRELEESGVGVAPVSRGGKWTYHGPGQLLLYPVAQLETLGYGRREVRRFVDDLRQVVSDALAELGVAAVPGETPYGLYVNGAKLVSFGVQVQRGVCKHGLALYLTPQEEYFRGIHPCGSPGQRVTSLRELGVVDEWEQVATVMMTHVKRVFKPYKS